MTAAFRRGQRCYLVAASRHAARDRRACLRAQAALLSAALADDDTNAGLSRYTDTGTPPPIPAIGIISDVRLPAACGA